MSLIDKIEKNQIILHTGRKEFGICLLNDNKSDLMTVQFEDETADVSKNFIVAINQQSILKTVND